MGKIKKFNTPDFDSNIHENMVEVFNEMLEINKISYEVVFVDDGESMEFKKIDEK